MAAEGGMRPHSSSSGSAGRSSVFSFAHCPLLCSHVELGVLSTVHVLWSRQSRSSQLRLSAASTRGSDPQDCCCSTEAPGCRMLGSTCLGGAAAPFREFRGPKHGSPQQAKWISSALRILLVSCLSGLMNYNWGSGFG